jgi:nucleoside-diphosphate-sugar epimerase
MFMAGSELHVVIGASGGIGGAIVRALVSRGHRVRAVNRAGDADVPDGVERVGTDVSTADGARRAVEGGAIVYHAAQPAYTRWLEQFPGLTRAIADAAADASARLVFVDNLYMYGPVEGPITEDTPVRATGSKGTLRARMADDLLEAHGEGRLSVAIGRASDYFGPGGRDSAIGDRLFEAALRRRKVPWLGSLDVPHTTSYTEDLGRAYATLGERPESTGRIWHLPAAPAVTGRQFVAMVQEALGRPLTPTVTSAGMVRLAGLFVPMIRELKETMPQWTESFVMDTTRFESTFGPFDTTPLPEAITTTVDWYRRATAGAA